MLESVQQAMGAGDYEAAERLLREAAAIQEANFGPTHHELAITLNNLALVCERTDKLAEAERSYRRAHAIAVASLAPGHPFVATSLKNLLDFCAAHGIPVWTPPASKSEARVSSSIPVTTPPPEEIFESEAPKAPASARRESAPRTIAIVALSVGAIVVGFFTIQWRGVRDSAAPSSTASIPTDRRAPEPPTPVATDRQTPVPVEPPSRPRATTTTTPAAVTVLNAQVCSALERRGSPDWDCTPVSGSHQPGMFVFYTRIQTNVDTTVEHRWYRAGRLHQRMRLRIRANQSGGYRTYSSNTVSSDRAGDWKVELRAADGTLLREESFLIR